MALNSFADVQAFITSTLQNLKVDPSSAPHLDFWNSLTYEQFTTGTVPGVDSVPILVVGDADNSNIIQALQGKGPLFSNGTYGRMPFSGPYFTDDQIAEIAAWINNKCPQ
jgi:hypothetical protein